ncbi:alcohol dehydrogenase-like [Glandiceps talaboti]
METAGILGCGMLTAYSSTKRAMKHTEEVLSRWGKCGILVIGAGGLGLSAIRFLRACLQNDRVELACADINENKLPLVLDNGCDTFIHWPKGASDDELITKTKSAFSASRLHIVLDFVGASTTFKVAYQSLAKHGLLVNIGLECKPFDMTLWPLVTRSLLIEGIYAGTLQDMKDLVDMVGKKVVTPLSQHSLHKLEDTQDCLEKLKRGEVNGRAVINFE